MKEIYLKQVEFMLEILPVLNEFNVFALKGGTAINFFFQNAPRLSVDIDLNYLPVEPRDKFLLNLTNELDKLADVIQNLDQDIFVKKLHTNKDKQLSKLLVSKDNVDVKIESNLVLRGYVFEPSKQRLCQMFLLSVKLGEPNWGLIDVPYAHQLPAIRWKLSNIQKLNDPKKNLLIEKLKQVLAL